MQCFSLQNLRVGVGDQYFPIITVFQHLAVGKDSFAYHFGVAINPALDILWRSFTFLQTNKAKHFYQHCTLVLTPSTSIV